MPGGSLALLVGAEAALGFEDVGVYVSVKMLSPEGEEAMVAALDQGLAAAAGTFVGYIEQVAL